MLITNWLLPLVLTLSSEGKPVPSGHIFFDPIEITEFAVSPGRLALAGGQASRVYSDLNSYLERIRFFHQTGTFALGKEWHAYTFSDWGKRTWIRFFFCSKGNEYYTVLNLEILGVRLQFLAGTLPTRLQNFSSVTKFSILFKKDSYSGNRIGLEFFVRQQPLEPQLKVDTWESAAVIFYFPRRAWKLRLGMIGLNYSAAL